MDKSKTIADLHAALGYKPLSRSWAKIELLLGLLAAGLGQLAMTLGVWAYRNKASDWPDRP